jgi:hypothetical protein
MSGGALFFADVFLALNVSTSPRVHPGASLSRQQLSSSKTMHAAQQKYCMASPSSIPIAPLLFDP